MSLNTQGIYLPGHRGFLFLQSVPCLLSVPKNNNPIKLQNIWPMAIADNDKQGSLSIRLNQPTTSNKTASSKSLTDYMSGQQWKYRKRNEDKTIWKLHHPNSWINRWIRVESAERSLKTIRFAWALPIDDCSLSYHDQLKLQRNQILPLVRGDLKSPGDRVVQFRPTK